MQALINCQDGAADPALAVLMPMVVLSVSKASLNLIVESSLCNVCMQGYVTLAPLHLKNGMFKIAQPQMNDPMPLQPQYDPQHLNAEQRLV